MKVSVIGLGKLGSPIVATLAYKGFYTYGVDINVDLIDEMNQGKTRLKEPLLADLLNKFKSNIYATIDIKQAILASDMTFVIVPTPSQKNGEFSLKYVISAVKEIGRVLKEKSTFHIVLLTSTVMPGSTLKIQALLEEISGKVCGRDFGLCYNPEFIALGNVVFGLLNPDFILIGESDKKTGDILVSFYKKYCDNKPKFARLNYINAELAKISFNTYVTTKISYANMLTEICEKLPGGDVDGITEAIGLHSIIGSKYIKGGMSYGGPCFPRDNIAFMSLAKKIKANSAIAAATHKTNSRQLKRLINCVLENVRPKEIVGILGLSYKPDTDVLEESQSFLLAQELIKRGISIYLYDPIALPNVKRFLNNRAAYAESTKECIESSDVVVIGTNWPEFKQLNPSWLRKKARVLIDPWRIMIKGELKDGLRYIPFGVYSNSDNV